MDESARVKIRKRMKIRDKDVSSRRVFDRILRDGERDRNERISLNRISVAFEGSVKACVQ